MRICKDCKKEKPLNEFKTSGRCLKTGKQWYRHRCIICHNLHFRPPTGIVSNTRFKKGHLSLRKIGNGGRESLKGREWKRLVFEKDAYKCQKCFLSDNLNAHHIMNWNDYPELRFEVNNGLTLCLKCHRTLHGKESGFKKDMRGPWLGKKMTLEQRKKLSDAHVGIKLSDETKAKLKTRIPAMLGKKHSAETKNKISESKKGTKLSEKHKEKLRGRVPWNKGLKFKEIICPATTV